ncbi:MAG: DUF2169 domain-containing protein [Sandaracinaceae bacterium]|nr:DUF2169 domain-containing protein [Sandaracinaceae bacterium]
MNSRVTGALDRFELYDEDGTRSVAVVVKQRFAWNDRGVVVRTDGATVEPVDVPWPDGQSPKIPSDLCLRKPSTDVVVSGHAVAPRPAPFFDVHVSVGPVAKSLRVFGLRSWHGSARTMKPSDALPTERVPLMWEHAFGGMDVSDPERAVVDHRNPYGTGLVCDPKTLEGAPVPQIEDPTDLIRSSRSRPKPAGVAACASHFEPRRSLAGTFDQRWQDVRMPLFPVDYDPRFQQVAVPELVTPAPLIGNERVRLLNLGHAGAIELQLPRLVFQVDAHTDRGVTHHRPMLDTVLLLPDDRQLDMVWRTALPLRRGPTRVREVFVFEKRVLQ